VKEMAAAINLATNNSGKVTASTMTVGGVPTLVLTSNTTGAANQVSIDASGLPGSPNALQDALSDPLNRRDLVVGDDAIVYLGDKTTGIKMQQPSNTFEVVDGVSMTFTKAQGALEDPVTLKVGADSTGTAANLQSLVDGWNKLIGTLNSLTAAGGEDGGSTGVFSADAGVKALATRMQSVLRLQVDGQSLVAFGVTGNRDGTLSLDTARLNKALVANPAALDKIIGSSSATTSSGVLGGMDKLLDSWTDSTAGQITKRREVNTRQQDALMDRQIQLDKQYDSAYIRYLTQFTTLQTLQAQMESTTSIFDAMFSKDV
jgi:flagellar hook-associated protein 2